jgi:hypothetical protein
VHAQLRRAIEDPEHRIMVVGADRPLLARIANPLRLGEQSAQYFNLGHHWPQHFDRKAAEAGLDGRSVTVGDLRAWLDEPQPMGLPAEVADLIVLVYAEQTNRSVLDGGRPVDVATLTALRADAVVVEQRLPGETDWAEAHARAQGLFGIGDVTDLRTARNVGVLADRVRAAVAAAAPPAGELVTRLGSRGPVVLGAEEVGGTDRYRIAHGAVRLCEVLAAAAGDVELVEQLARFELPAQPLHVGTALSSAPAILAAMQRMDWNILATVASWGPEHPLGLEARDVVRSLADAWQAGQFVTPLEPALNAADAAARQLVLRASAPAPPPPSPVPQPVSDGAVTGERVVGATDLDAVTGELAALVRAGKKVRITWQVVE